MNRRGITVRERLATTPQALARISALEDDYATLAAEIERLRAIIEAAPHDDDCVGGYPGGECTCWKADAEGGN